VWMFYNPTKDTKGKGIDVGKELVDEDIIVCCTSFTKGYKTNLLNSKREPPKLTRIHNLYPLTFK